MKQILIDTDILFDHLITVNKESVLMKLLAKYDCFTTVINAIELYEMVGVHEKKYADMILFSLKVLGIPGRYADKTLNLMKNVKNRNDRNLRNSIIATMAIQNDLILATFSIKKYLDFVNLKLLKITKKG